MSLFTDGDMIDVARKVVTLLGVLQPTYFRTRAPADLHASKKAEAELLKLARNILFLTGQTQAPVPPQQLTLFEDSPSGLPD